MSHEPITIKPISEVAQFLKNLIPANMPDNYAIKPMFKNIASEEDIRKGIIAFRDFLYLLCDRLAIDGHLYAKPPKKPKSVMDYPFLHYITNMLVDIGYYGKLSEATASKIPAASQKECLEFLILCGFSNNPIMLTGLKVMSIADMELREGRRYWNDNNLLRCDYRLIKAEATDVLDILKDYLHPLPEKVQDFAVKLHKRYTDLGMTCVTLIDDQHHFAYAYLKNSRKVLSPRDKYYKRVWEFSISLKNGYCLVVRAKKTDEYADIIETFPPYLREKIAQGYGCDRKLRNERCQMGCQGIRIPLDESILDIAGDLETWLNKETRDGSKKNQTKN